MRSSTSSAVADAATSSPAKICSFSQSTFVTCDSSRHGCSEVTASWLCFASSTSERAPKPPSFPSIWNRANTCRCCCGVKSCGATFDARKDSVRPRCRSAQKAIGDFTTNMPRGLGRAIRAQGVVETSFAVPRQKQLLLRRQCWENVRIHFFFLKVSSNRLATHAGVPTAAPSATMPCLATSGSSSHTTATWPSFASSARAITRSTMARSAIVSPAGARDVVFFQPCLPPPSPPPPLSLSPPPCF